MAQAVWHIVGWWGTRWGMCPLVVGSRGAASLAVSEDPGLGIEVKHGQETSLG